MNDHKVCPADGYESPDRLRETAVAFLSSGIAEVVIERGIAFVRREDGNGERINRMWFLSNGPALQPEQRCIALSVSIHLRIV